MIEETKFMIKGASVADDHHDQEETSNEVVERDFNERFKAMYSKLLGRLQASKHNSNSFSSSLRLFRIPATATLGFPTVDQLRHSYARGISAIYIFKLHHQHKDGFTHGIHMRLNGFVHRHIFERVIEEIVCCFCGERIELKTAIPMIRKSISLFDYLQTLYVLSGNLLVNYCHYLDAVVEDHNKSKVNNANTAALKNKMNQLTTQILDNMIAMPAKYPQYYLYSTLGMKTSEFRKHMRTTNISEVTYRVASDAYAIALQDRRLRPSEAQELMEPVTRRAMLNRAVSDRTTKSIQLLFQQTFGTSFVHPHPYNGIVRSELCKMRPLDGIVFDPRFLFNILLVSRWFAGSCMREDDLKSNNRAHLLLYGGAGTGKTLLVSAIAGSISTYKYLVGSRFQNPDMLNASLMSIDEFDTRQLPGNQYKQLLDLKTHVKVDFKNLHPENVTEGMPCMITTNDEVFSILQAQRKHQSASVNAALRRLYIIPMKGGQFEKIHSRMPRTSAHYAELCQFDPRFDQEPNRLARIFNLIVGFALYQTDIQGLYFDARIHNYFQKLAKEFALTTFGTFYLTNKIKVDELIRVVEEAMEDPEQDDSSYLVKVSTCIGQFQQLLIQFLEKICQGNAEIKLDLVKDPTVPWPIKCYYLHSSLKFSVMLMWQVDDTPQYLNKEVRDFIENPNMQLFKMIEAIGNESPIDEHADLQRSKFDSEDESQSDDIFGMKNIYKLMDEPKPDITEQHFAEVESILDSLGKRSFSQMMGVDGIMDEHHGSMEVNNDDDRTVTEHDRTDQV